MEKLKSDENFFELFLDQYIDEEVIKEKIRLEDEEYEKETQCFNSNNHNDLYNLSGYAITIEDFLKKYLKMDIKNIQTDNLTHRNLKDLTRDNPLVIGIYNGYVDIDEVIKQDYLIVTDCHGNIGSYLNPEFLKDFTKLELIKQQLEIMKKVRISILSDLQEFYNEYSRILEELEYLNSKCSSYEEMLKKVGKTKSLKNIKLFVEQHGPSSLNIN